MRKQFPEIVEKGRVMQGEWGTMPGDTYGAFIVQLKKKTHTAHVKVIVGDGAGWDHVSVSLKNRCPTWGEMQQIKNLFFEPDEVVMQLHVGADDHINCHEYCLHLWRPQNVEIPLPPKIMV